MPILVLSLADEMRKLITLIGDGAGLCNNHPIIISLN
jgi:hypothetical protein